MATHVSRLVAQKLPVYARRPHIIQPLQVVDTWRSLSTSVYRSSSQNQSRKSFARANTNLNFNSRHPRTHNPRQSSLGPNTFFTASVGAAALFLITSDFVQHDQAVTSPDCTPIQETSSNDSNDGLPLYRLSEIAQHGSSAERPWVTCGDKVYDITDWIPAHPGGQVILRAAGGSIEPYWDIFTIHKTPYVREILEQYVIGRIHPDDLLGDRQAHIEDPFTTDPERDQRMRFLTQKPCNAESPGDALADSFLTPNELFYKRNHMWVPVVDDPDSHAITIELPDGNTKVYTVGELKSRFRQHVVTAVLQCSGNRRNDMTVHAKKTNGLQWTVGAISCAKWEGVHLRDVLAEAGLPINDPGCDALHVQFSSLEGYGASIPIESALDPRGDVLLAFRMNDEPLPRDHGFPVRIIVPGHVAARSVKWVNKISVSDDESTTSWQRKDYKCFGPNETKQDWDKYKAIQKMPVTSAITRTRVKQTGKGNLAAPAQNSSSPIVEVEGYAYSGGGHEIQRVDISLDGGKTWDQARLVQDDQSLERGSKPWCWKRWKYQGVLPTEDASINRDGTRSSTIVVKATDDVYNTQPESYASIYNLRGNLATAWHRVDLNWGRTTKQSKERDV